jgi:hypothetical protein
MYRQVTLYHHMAGENLRQSYVAEDPIGVEEKEQAKGNPQKQRRTKDNINLVRVMDATAIPDHAPEKTIVFERER